MKHNKIRLGVNIDHVATLRQARGGAEPGVLCAASAVKAARAYGITVHLREDRRHIQDQDVFDIRRDVSLPLNLEMSLAPDIVKISLKLRPHSVCIVPEKRRELTTEGGFDVIRNRKKLAGFIPYAKKRGIKVSLFIDPEPCQVLAAAEGGAYAVELHTGNFAQYDKQPGRQKKQLDKLIKAAEQAGSMGLHVHAGHGLNYFNTSKILCLPNLEELNIGHSIISRSVFTGLKQAVKEMLKIIDKT